MKLKYRNCLETLTRIKNVKYTHADISKLLDGKVSPNALANRYFKDGYLSSDEVGKIESSLGFSFDFSQNLNSDNDCVEIGFIRNFSEEARMVPVKLGVKFINDILGVSKPDKLKIAVASGDSMEDGIEDKNILLIDTSRTDYTNGGIFVITINDEWFIKRLRLKVTGELDIISDNPKYPVETLKGENLNSFAVQGRVIKNLSRGL